MKLASISVDLDEVPCYAAIHAIDVPADSEHAIYDHALPRLSALLACEERMLRAIRPRRL